jgi:hypothetical protein
MLAVLGVMASVASAAGPVQSPVQAPVQAPSLKVVVEEVPVCSNRCINYVRLRPRLEPCGPHHEIVILVKDNWACCYVEVPMCLPNCCLGEPQMCRKGLHVVEYSWTSGYKVRVILAKNGKVFVHYNAA